MPGVLCPVDWAESKYGVAICGKVNFHNLIRFAISAVPGVNDVVCSKSIDVLEKGCPLNFKEYLKNKNTCAQSYISKGTVLIDRLSDDKVFDILIRWSFADYLWEWLSDSCSEYIE